MSEYLNSTWFPEVQEIGNKIAALSIGKGGELSDFLREVHNLKPGTRDRTPPPPPPPPVPVPTKWTVQLDGFHPTKNSWINLIKVVREITRLGLKEAKELVEGAPRIQQYLHVSLFSLKEAEELVGGAPKLIKENLPTAEAEALKNKLE